MTKEMIDGSTRLILVSNQRRHPELLRTFYDEAKSLYPWKSEAELMNMAKVEYAKHN